jgi:hypothetical protein
MQNFFMPTCRVKCQILSEYFEVVMKIIYDSEEKEEKVFCVIIDF